MYLKFCANRKGIELRTLKLNEPNQGPNARHYSSTEVKSGLFPPHGGFMRRGPFLGKQKGTKERDKVYIGSKSKVPNSEHVIF